MNQDRRSTRASPPPRRPAGRVARNAFLASFLLALAACAAPQVAPLDPASLLRDAAFRASAVPADPGVFAVSAAMKHFLEVEIADQLRAKGKLAGLIAALESNAQLKLEYESASTRTAAEAFAARSGNCLSLTLMTAALARELGLSVTFRRVYSDESWARSDDIVFVGGHVNIALEPALAERDGFARSGGVIVDFLPHAEVQRYRWREIREHTVSAMYMNNRAAESMALGELDEAYGWARAAIVRDPRFLEAYNTLGVVYSRHGDLAAAEQVFRRVLALEAENVSALSNLAVVLQRQGRPQAAREFAEMLRRIEPHPPFHFFDLGLAALRRKDYAQAREHFARELRRNAAYHEAHFGLAIAEFGLDDARAAQRHLAAALEASTGRRERELYAAKLEWLRAHRAP